MEEGGACWRNRATGDGAAERAGTDAARSEGHIARCIEPLT